MELAIPIALLAAAEILWLWLAHIDRNRPYDQEADHDRS